MSAVLDRPAFRPSQRVASLGVSGILRITDKANALKRAGRPVIVLGAGEPDFDTPPNIVEAAVRALARGETRYTVLDGSVAMKEAVPRDRVLVTESGILGPADVARMRAAGVNAFLVGEAFMRLSEPGEGLRAMFFDHD